MTDEPTQRTEKGAEIPIPKRSAWDKVLKRAAQPKDEAEDQMDKPDDHMPPKPDPGRP